MVSLIQLRTARCIENWWNSILNLKTLKLIFLQFYKCQCFYKDILDFMHQPPLFIPNATDEGTQLKIFIQSFILKQRNDDVSQSLPPRHKSDAANTPPIPNRHSPLLPQQKQQPLQQAEQSEQRKTLIKYLESRFLINCLW